MTAHERLSRIVFGPNPIHSRDPRLQLWRLRHWMFGPWMGCSCSRCFYNPRRIVHGPEIIHVNQRLAELEDKVRKATHDNRS